MPLLDHFHSPLSEQRPWESFHSTWATTIVDALNRDILPARFIARSPSSAVEIVSTEGGRTLVAAIELVSPGNKDRATKQRLFAAKCATYLSRGIGLIIIDAVTNRQANLHNEMIDLVGWDADLRIPAAPAIYCVAYRPLHEEKADRVETWHFPLAIGEPLPAVPLSLAADHCVALDLETSYADACQRRWPDEVGG